MRNGPPFGHDRRKAPPEDAHEGAPNPVAIWVQKRGGRVEIFNIRPHVVVADLGHKPRPSLHVEVETAAGRQLAPPDQIEFLDASLREMLIERGLEPSEVGPLISTEIPTIETSKPSPSTVSGNRPYLVKEHQPPSSERNPAVADEPPDRNGSARLVDEEENLQAVTEEADISPTSEEGRPVTNTNQNNRQNEQLNHEHPKRKKKSPSKKASEPAAVRKREKNIGEGKSKAAAALLESQRSFGEIPATIDIDRSMNRINLFESAEEVVAEVVDPFYEAWSEYRIRANVFGGPLLSTLWSMRKDAIELAKVYEVSRNIDDLGNLRSQLQLINAHGKKLEQEVQQHQIDLNRLESETSNTQVETGAPELGDAEQPDTRKEHEEKLKSAVAGFTDRPEGAAIEPIRKELSPYKVALDEAQKAYLAEYTQFQATRGTFTKRPEELKRLEAEYLASLSKYDEEVGKSTAKSAGARLEKKFDGNPNIRVGKDGKDRRDKIAERYARMARFREVIKPASEAKYDAYLQALQARRPGAARIALKWTKAGNDWIDTKAGGKTGGRIVKAVAVTAALGGLGAAAGTIAVGGLLSWGAWRVARAVIGGGILGAAGGALVADVASRTLGQREQRSNKKFLETSGRVKNANETLDSETLKRIINERVGAHYLSDEQKLENDKAVVRAVAAVLLGAEASAQFDDIMGVIGVHAPDVSPGGSADSHEQSSGRNAHTVAEPAHPGGNSGPQEHSETGVRPNAAPTDTIRAPATNIDARVEIGRGEGADQLFHDLRSQVAAQYHGDVNNAPPAIKALLEKSPHEFARTLGFSDDTASRLMTSGESLRIDHDQLVFHDANSGQDITLIDRQGHISPGTIEKIHTNMLPDSGTPQRAEAAPSAHEPTRQSAPESNGSTPDEPVTHSEHAPPAPEEGLPHAPVDGPEDSDAPAEPAPENPHPVGAAPSVDQDIDTSSEPTADPDQAQGTSEAPENASARPSVNNAEVFTNHHGVPVNAREIHTYAAPDRSASGRESLIAYGGVGLDRDASFARIQELTRLNPRTDIFLQSPEPIMVNGSPQPWVTIARYTPEAGFMIDVTPSNPGLVGVTLNPQTFTRIVH